MVNFELANEMWRVSWSTWHERGTKKKSESPTGIKPMTSRTLLNNLQLNGPSSFILPLTMTLTVPILTICRMPVLCIQSINSVKWSCSPRACVAQWIERLPGVWEVMGLISVRDSDFYFVPRSCHADQFTIHITKLKIHLIHLYSLAVMVTLTVLILGVCRRPVTYKLS